MKYTDTIAALATPFGTGGIAIIRLSGCCAIAIADLLCRLRHFDSVALLPAQFLEHMSLWIDDCLIDRGLVVRFGAPRSYTGEDIVELHLHGNMLIASEVLNFIIAQGGRLAEPGEFARRAFINGKLDLTQVEALAEVISADSIHHLELAQRQLQGELRRKFDALRKQVVSFLALLELELDFCEEGYAFVAETELQSFLTGLLSYVNELLAGYNTGEFRRFGPKILLLGSPNSGKSSLFNSLIGYSRAIVSSIPGTTRDYIEESVYYRGLTLRFVDTAGLREVDEQIEAAGIVRARDLIGVSDLVLYLIDGSDTSRLADEKNKFITLKREYPEIAFFLLLTKSDLYSDSCTSEFCCSIYFRDSISQLLDCITEYIQPRTSEALALLSQRQTALLRSIEVMLGTILGYLPMPTEVLASELRRLLVPLSQLTGAVTNDDILSEIFSGFCIGK
jgi:tRNA modification GTPase